MALIYDLNNKFSKLKVINKKKPSVSPESFTLAVTNKFSLFLQHTTS